MKKKIYIISLGLMLISCLIFITSIENVKAAGNTFYVGGTGDGNYTKIQDAIDNATNGDLIFVFSGTYYENVNVNKQLTIKGDNKKSILDANKTGNGFYISADDVIISGFKIVNSSNSSVFFIGIFLNNTINCCIKNNQISNHYLGIGGFNVSKCEIYDNNITDNKGEHDGQGPPPGGLAITGKDNQIFNNTVIENTIGIGVFGGHGINQPNVNTFNNSIYNNYVSKSILGIAVYNSSKNSIINNIIWNNTFTENENNLSGGIALVENADENIIEDNTINNNSYGILCMGSSKNIMNNNSICFNKGVNGSENPLPSTGIVLSNYSNNNNISNCKIYNNSFIGILILSSDNNTISNCYIYKNPLYGIILYYSFNNNISNCISYNNADYGIVFVFSSKNNISKCITHNNIVSIYLYDSSNNTITNCETYNNTDHGINLDNYSTNNKISNCISFNNEKYGIYLKDFSNSNALYNCHIYRNTKFGIYISACEKNLIYNNYFNNTNNARNNGINFWNTSITSGPNIIGGPNIGGNFWSDYKGIDTNYDGFGDTDLPYNSNGNITSGGDWLPLTEIPDNEPPEITNVTDVPDPQISDGFVNISCEVTDNKGVDNVKVNITDPNGDSTNLTMKVGSYYLNKTYSIIGTYNYFIWANDTSGNDNKSTGQSFQINPKPDTEPPAITKVGANPDFQESGRNVNITCDVKDDTEVNEVWVYVTYPNSSIDKFKMKQGSYYRNITFTQNGTYGYYIWANDTSGNENTSDFYQFWICKDINVTEYQIGLHTIYWNDLKLRINLTNSANITLIEYAENPHQEGKPPNSLNKYIDIDIENWDTTVNPPINLTIYYAQDELNATGLLEEQLMGIYFWNETSKNWELYSITGVNTTNQIGYAGYVWAEAWHLTPIGIGGKENQHPYVDILSPTAGQTVSDEITITGNSSDPDGNSQIQKIQIRIDNTAWRDASGTTSWSYSWDTTTVSDGSHTIYARAYDGKNYSDIKSVDVTVDNDEDTGGGGGGGEENLAPVADANGPYIEFLGVPVDFDGSGSSDDGTIVSYEWDFGDGSTGSGVSPSYTYTAEGNYTVILTVTDDGGLTDSSTTYVIISGFPNNPPLKPVLIGPRSGTKNKAYNFTAQSTDIDNDTLRYIFSWDDGTNTTTEPLPNGTMTEQSHNWTAAGIYTISVYVLDEHNATSGTAEVKILIDTHYCKDIGYLIDENGDGTFDKFHNNETGKNTTVEYRDGKYLINTDDDIEWEYMYSIATGLESYKETVEDKDENIILFVGLFIFVIVLLFIILLKTKGKLSVITKKKKKK